MVREAWCVPDRCFALIASFQSSRIGLYCGLLQSLRVMVLPLILGFLPTTLLSGCSIGGDREEAKATSPGSIEDSKDLLALFCLGSSV
jgi:hypothetical protein